jgi:poly(A) polymerase
MTPRAIAVAIVRRLQQAGHEACLVGGCVRDTLLGREPEDFDVATAAKPDEVEALFPKTIPVGRQFGVIIVLDGGVQTQVATFRADAEYIDGRRPVAVRFAAAREDALRRDFTINGLFEDPVSGQILDWVGGRDDLNARVIRAIGDPAQRFAEDHLRVLRAVRFAAQLDFTIEAQTLAAVRAHAPTLRDISAERVRDELLKLFRAPHAGRGLRLLRDTGVLPVVLPEIAATIGCEQPPEHHPEGDVFTHICNVLDHLPAGAPDSLAWAALLHDVAKPVTATRHPETGRIQFLGHEVVGAEMAEAILRRLRFPAKQLAEITFAVRHHMQFKDVPKMRTSTLRRMLLRGTFPLELELHRLDRLGSAGRLEIYEQLVQARAELDAQPQLAAPLLNGGDLIALGIGRGPRLGEWLERIRDRQLEGTLATPEAAREWVREELAAESGKDGAA